MNDEERLEQLDEALEQLEEAVEGAVLLTEGRKDRRSLEALGIRCDMILVQSQGGPLRAAEDVAASGRKAVILTDWDDRGDRIASELACQLDALCVSYDSSVRQRLADICRKDIKDVESLASLRRRLAGACGKGEREISTTTMGVPMSGLFIVFDGIDGTGKTTLCESVARSLKSEGRDVAVTAEPTRGEIGSIIRDGRVKGITQAAEALLFVADRAMHTREMLSQRDGGTVVLCDRYYASTLAYQSAPLDGRALDIGWLWELNAPVIAEPDMTFILDMDPEETLARIGVRGATSKYEKLEYLRKVRENYLRLAEEKGYMVIDASKSKEQVLEEVLEAIRSKV